MKTVGIIGSSVLGLVLVAGGINWYTVNKTATKMENSLEAKLESNKNELSSYSTKVQEIAQIAKLSIDSQQKLMKIANETRYGGAGNNVAQVINENNIPMDLQTLNEFTTIVRTERDRYRNVQNELRDQVRQYKDLWASPINAMMLHPQIDLKQFELVINQYTDNAYKTKRAEAIDLKLN